MSLIQHLLHALHQLTSDEKTSLHEPYQETTITYDYLHFLKLKQFDSAKVDYILKYRSEHAAT